MPTSCTTLEVKEVIFQLHLTGMSNSIFTHHFHGIYHFETKLRGTFRRFVTCHRNTWQVILTHCQWLLAPITTSVFWLLL